MSKESNNQQAIREFLQEWWLTEKAAERIAGMLLIFAGALTLVMDRPADAVTPLAAAAFIAGGFTFIFRSRRPNKRRQSVHFASASQFTTRSAFAGFGAALAIVQGANLDRALFLIAGGLLILVALWYQWRARKIRVYDSLTQPEPVETRHDLETD